MLNIGCGGTYHPDWVNLDVAPADPNVLTANINNGLPFSSESATVCYSSHVLEHLDKAGAHNLIAECFRVLKRGGVIRLAVPDLEAMAREYLRILDAVTSGDASREFDYDWIMLELYDQTIRNSPGGDMARFLADLSEKDRLFVRSRIGVEADGFWVPKQALARAYKLNTLVKKFRLGKLLKLLREKLASWLVYLIAGKAAYKSFKMGSFRASGEVHQWMYDRYSLKRLLDQAGFVNVRVCAANESRIPEYEKYSLDVLNITPIIKKIATSSFVFASGGWAILALCFFYWLVDVKRLFIDGSKFFIIVGMNSIFIYLFMHVGGAGVLHKIFTPFTKALFSWGGALTVGIVTSLAVWASLWYICYWLYKHRLFIKI